MVGEALSANQLRIIITLVGLVILALMYWFGTRTKTRGQGKRVAARDGRREPVLDDGGAEALDDPLDTSWWPKTADDAPEQGELAVDPSNAPAAPSRPQPSQIGRRPAELPVERIVTLFVVAREAGARFRGTDIVVAAEKAGLEFGDMEIFHRTVDNRTDAGPVFSAANMVKPGSFDVANLENLETPGLSLFMTLPGPLRALDAWETMLPTAHRLAELLDGLVIDDKRNALGRQRIAYIRDDLRAFDRKHEGEDIEFGRS